MQVLGLEPEFASVLTVLALQVEELLLYAGQLTLQGFHSGSVLVLQLPQLFPVGLTLGLNLVGQVGLSVVHLCSERPIL